MRWHALSFWICLCAYLNFAGWTLAVLHELNPTGCAVVIALGLSALAWFKPKPRPLRWQRFFHRFRRPLPAIYLVLTGLIFAGGLLYAPNNFDALTYRLPRMLNWLTEGTWHWIPTVNTRMNGSGAAWEWTAMQWLALTHLDRGLFLINTLGFLLLPGLLFSVFSQLGVSRRVAWSWMWILPLGYGFATQAGSIGNDLLGALFCLLSVHFGLRARRTGSVADVWLALLAAALLTGVKLSNLPLALPCLVAVWPALGQVRKNLVGSLGVAGIAIVISALPIMALNQLHTGGWTGDPQDKYQVQVKSPAAALLGNSLLVAEQSFMPPLLPGAGKINDGLVQHLPAAWHQFLEEKFPRFFLNTLNEIPGEEAAGLGLGLTLLLLASLGATMIKTDWRGIVGKVLILFPPVVLAAWVATGFFLLKMGSESAPRLLLPYYLLALTPCLLLPIQRQLLHSRLWRWALALTALSILPALVLSVSRPLWPARSISEPLAHSHPENLLLRRLATTYAAYGHRNDLLEPIRSQLPPDAREIGFIAGNNDTDYSLWRPFGQRRVISLRQSDRHFLAHPEKTEWLVIKANEWPNICNVPLAEWAPANHFQMVFSTEIVELVRHGGETWCLLHYKK